MDPDPSSLAYILLSQPPQAFLVYLPLPIFLLLLLSFVQLICLSLVQRYLAILDKEQLEKWEQQPFIFDKLTHLYRRSHRISMSFNVTKLILAVTSAVLVYTLGFILNLNFYVINLIAFIGVSIAAWALPLLLYRYTDGRFKIALLCSYPLLRLSISIANKMIPKERLIPQEDINIEVLTNVLPSSEEGQPTIANLNLYKQVLRFDKIKVHHVMRPKNELEGIKSNYNFKEVLTKIKSTSHSRLPVYEGSWNKVLGIVHCKDLLPYTKYDQLDWKKKIRPIIYVQERDLAQAVLRIFQQSKNHMALVQNTNKRLVGLVTLEDITEEIIGEIEDE